MDRLESRERLLAMLERCAAHQKEDIPIELYRENSYGPAEECTMGTEYFPDPNHVSEYWG